MFRIRVGVVVRAWVKVSVNVRFLVGVRIMGTVNVSI